MGRKFRRRGPIGNLDRLIANRYLKAVFGRPFFVARAPGHDHIWCNFHLIGADATCHVEMKSVLHRLRLSWSPYLPSRLFRLQSCS
jgi:hypothetical protein